VVSGLPSGRGASLKIILVLVNVGIQLCAAITLNAASSAVGIAYAAGIFVVLALNGARFLSWGMLNNRYSLSEVYPLTTLFFPILYAYSVVFKNVPIEPHKIVGICLISFGAACLTKVKGRDAN
jgi:drug/metabolite transporter (DMT)-like permease